MCVILVHFSSFRLAFLNLHLIPACKLIFHILTAFKRNRCSVEKELCRVVGLISSRDEGVFPSCDTARVAGKTPRGAALQSNLPSGLLYETHVCEAGLHVCTTRSERSSFNCPLTRSISFPVFSGKLFGFQMRFSRLTAQWSRLSGLRCDSVFLCLQLITVTRPFRSILAKNVFALKLPFCPFIVSSLFRILIKENNNRAALKTGQQGTLMTSLHQECVYTLLSAKGMN